MGNPNDRVTIHSLRLSIKEAIELLEYEYHPGSAAAVAILQAAYDYTDPKILDKDCGCG